MLSVDRAGILVADATATGSVGSFDYELELLHDQSSGEKDSNQNQSTAQMELHLLLLPVH